jgi:preprotein translocase subunit SecE
MGLFDYLRDVRGELRHVSWPTRSQTVNFTVIVISISVATGLFLGLLDYLFSGGLKQVIGL